MLKNPPVDRLKFIAKQYGEKYPGVVIAMIDIIAQAVGEDRWKQHVNDAIEMARQRAVEASGSSPQALDDAVDAEKLERQLRTVFPSIRQLPFDFHVGELRLLLPPLIAMVSELPGFQRPNAADGAFPWMAKQLVAEVKDYQGGDKGSMREYGQRAWFFREKGTAFGLWMKKARPDINSMSYEDVKDEVESFEVEEQVPQGEVIHRFDDGYTVQKLTTKAQLDAEGRLMQHCVGSYCEDVRRGDSVIYSLRDERGRPHVTMEVDPRTERLAQVKGKQNAKPQPKYQKYVDEFAEAHDISKTPNHLKPYVAMLEAAGQDIEDEYLVDYAQEWEQRFTVEDAKAWLDAGVWHSDYELVDGLTSVTPALTPEEYSSFPYAVHEKLTSGGGYPSNGDEIIEVARMANKLFELAPERPPATHPGQMALFDLGPGKRRRGQDPGVVVEKRYTGGYTVKELPSHRFARPWHGVDIDDEHSLWLTPAEEWVDAGFSSDPDDDGYVGPWFLLGFTPSHASDWWDAGDGELAADVAFELEKHNVKPEDLSGLDLDRLKTAEQILQALGRPIPNRRR